MLVVDDEPANIDLVKGILPETIKVKAALKGEVAIKLVGKQMPDLIVLDLIMPGLSGFETLAQIRKLDTGQQVPVVIISGNAQQSDIEQGQQLGVIGHLQKPIKATELLAIVDKL